MSFGEITVVSVYGHTDGRESLPSIRNAMLSLPGSKGLLLSAEKPPKIDGSIEWRSIDRLDYRQYSLFMMYGLDAHVFTDYCLCVQSDGFVVNSEAWSDRFYDFDFIGALTPCALHSGSFSSGFSWLKSEDDPIVVQNGGFSLRSKKMLGALSRHGIGYFFGNNEIFNYEDVQISGLFRRKLERLGYNFATHEISKSFSLEYYHPELKIENFMSIFGAHKKFGKMLSDKSVNYSADGLKVFGEDIFRAFLRANDFNLIIN